MEYGQQNTTGEALDHNVRLVKYTLMQANADGRPLSQLFGNSEFVGNVVARFTLYEGSHNKELNQELVDELAEHRSKTRGGVDAATWGR